MATETEILADLSASGSSAFFEGAVKADVLPRQRRERVYRAENVRVEINLSSPAPNPRPSTVLFGGLQDPVLQVQRAIPLEVRVEESTVVVRWPEIDEFGTGDTLSEALDDFAHAVRELYHHLNAAEIQPGADLLRVKQVLARYVEPRTK